MGQIMKTFLGIFFLMLLALLGTGIVSAQMDSAHARDYKEMVVAELENSGCSRQVVEACVKQAKQDGYELSVSLYEEGNARSAGVCLCYEYRIPLLQYLGRQKIWGYAL